MTETLLAMPADFLLEAIVCILLMATILYCSTLSRRLRAMRSGQDGLRKLITDLSTATTQASEAIAQLKLTTDATGMALNEQIKRARGLTEELQPLIEGGAEMSQRLQQLEERRHAAQAQAAKSIPTRAPMNAPTRRMAVSPAPSIPVSSAMQEGGALPRIIPSAPAQKAQAQTGHMSQPRQSPQAAKDEGRDAVTSSSELHSLIKLLKRAQA